MERREFFKNFAFVLVGGILVAKTPIVVAKPKRFLSLKLSSLQPATRIDYRPMMEIWESNGKTVFDLRDESGKLLAQAKEEFNEWLNNASKS